MPVGALVASQGSARQRVRAVLDHDNPPTPAPSSITITPTPFSVAEGATIQLTATVLDQFGQEMAGQTVAWSSSATGVATVGASTGLVTGVASGSCTITASVTGANVSKGGVCTVSPAVVASVDLTPTSMTLVVGGSTNTFTAQPRDASGNALAGRTVTAPSSDTNVATTSVSGYTVTVTAVGAGSCTVTATCETIPSSARSVSVSVAAAHHRPADVTMVQLVSADWTTPTLDVALGTNATVEGWDSGTGGNNMVPRRLQDQATWRTAAAAAFPAETSSDDRVLVTTFTTTTAAEKGHLEPTASIAALGAKTLYHRRKLTISSDWVNQNSSSTKLGTYASGSSRPVLILYGSKNSATGTMKPTFNVSGNVAPGTVVVGTTSLGTLHVGIRNFTRNVTHDLEVIVVPESSSGVSDGHMTCFMDSEKILQVTGMQFGGLTFSRIESLIYFGGAGTTTPTQQQQVVEDLSEVWYSTSRAAVPA